MPAAVTLVRSTYTDTDSFNAAAFNALTASSASVPDATPGTAGVMPGATTAAGLAMIAASDVTAQRALLSLSSMALQAAGAVAITGGTIAATPISGSTGAFTTVTASSTIAATGAVTGSNLSGTNTGDQTTITGNAGSATILQAGRNINGVSFNGSADITVTAAAGTLTGATLASGVTASSLTSLGTIASLVATTADINGGTIDGTTVGATTPSTVAATVLGLGNFSVGAASASVLRFTGNQASNNLQGYDGTNAYGLALFNAGAANVVIQSNGASSFAGGINSTPLGTGGASTVAATTISATGQITSTLAGGTAPFVISSTTNVANLNASSLNGATFASPGAIGSGTASTGAFTTLSSTTGANFATTSGSVGIGTASPTAKLHIDSGTQKLVKSVTVNNSTQTIVSNSAEGVSGLCWIRNASVGGQALVLWDISHGLTIVSQLGSIFTTSSPSATEIQLSVGGSSPYYVQAIAGATRNGDELRTSAINNQ